VPILKFILLANTNFITLIFSVCDVSKKEKLFEHFPDYQNRLKQPLKKVFYNQLGQPVGKPVEGWIIPPRPPTTPLVGKTCQESMLSSNFYSENFHPERRSWCVLLKKRIFQISKPHHLFHPREKIF